MEDKEECNDRRRGPRDSIWRLTFWAFVIFVTVSLSTHYLAMRQPPTESGRLTAGLKQEHRKIRNGLCFWKLEMEGLECFSLISQP